MDDIQLRNIQTKKISELDTEIKRMRDFDGTYIVPLGKMLDNSLMYELGSKEIPDDNTFDNAVRDYNLRTPLTPYRVEMSESIILVTKYILEFLTASSYLASQKKTNKSANILDNYPELFEEACKNYDEFIIQPVYSDNKIIVACETMNGMITSMSSVMIYNNNASLCKVNTKVEELIRCDLNILVKSEALSKFKKIVFEFDIHSNLNIVNIRRIYKDDGTKENVLSNNTQALILKNVVVYDTIYNIAYMDIYKDLLFLNNRLQFNTMLNIIKINPLVDVSANYDKLPITDYKYNKFIMLVKSNDISNSDKHYISELIAPNIINNSIIISNEILYDISHRMFLDRPENVYNAKVKNILLNNNYNNGISIIIIIECMNKNGQQKDEIRLYVNDKYSIYKVLLGYITLGTLVYYNKGGEKGKKQKRKFRFLGNYDAVDIDLSKNIKSLENFDIFLANISDIETRRKYNLDPDLDKKNLDILIDIIKKEVNLDIASKKDLTKNIFEKSLYCDLLRVIDELDPELLLIKKHTLINAIYKFNDDQSINKILASLVLGSLFKSLLINPRLYNLVSSVIIYSNINICNILNAVFAISKYDITDKPNLKKIHKHLILKYGFNLLDQILGFASIINRLLQEDNTKIIEELSEDSYTLLDDILILTSEKLFIDNFLQLISLIKEKI